MAKSPSLEQPKPPPFFPVDIPNAYDQSFSADVRGYGLMDEDFLTRFPGLVSGRETNIEKATKQLTGPLDPSIQNAFVKEGLSKGLNTYGGGSSGDGMSKGSASQNLASATLAGRTQEYKDYSRASVDSLLSENKQRAFGFSGSNAADLSILNTGQINNVSQSNYANQVSLNNSQNAADTQATNANIGMAVAIASLIASIAFSDKRLKTDIKKVGKSEMGIPIKTFRYKGDKQKYVGAVAQDVEKVVPQAVVKDKKGMRAVKYGLIDVPFLPVRGKA